VRKKILEGQPEEQRHAEEHNQTLRRDGHACTMTGMARQSFRLVSGVAA